MSTCKASEQTSVNQSPSVTLTDDQSVSMSGISPSIRQTIQDGSGSDLVEVAVEEFFDFRPFEGHRLELSFVVVVEERQSFSSICGRTNKELAEMLKKILLSV